MTPTEATIQDIRLIALNTDGFSWSAVPIDSVRLLLARHDRYEKALRDVHEGAARQLAEPRNHDNDQYALTAIATRVEEALL